jgi:hypothetical protein
LPPDDIPTWILKYHRLMAPVTALSGQAQLLRRQLLRADGLTNLERDMLLGTLASMMASVEALGDEARTWAAEDEAPPDASSCA